MRLLLLVTLFGIVPLAHAENLLTATSIEISTSSSSKDISFYLAQSERKRTKQPNSSSTAPSAEPQQGQIEYSAEEFERAWACEPSIIRWKGRYSIDFESPNCFRKPESELQRYRMILYSQYGGLQDQASQATFDAESRRRSELRQQAVRKAEEVAAAPTVQRQRDLKAGRIKISSFEDAVLALSPQFLEDIMEQPLLTADSGNYAGAVVIDLPMEQNILRVKLLALNPAPKYAMLRIGPKTVNWVRSGMRVGGTVLVIGRYVGNTRYRTVSGEERIAPVLEALYVGESQSGK